MKGRTKSAIGKQNRKRGQDFERLVAKELAKVWPEARRNLSQTRTAKKEGGDILGTPYFVECKSSKKADLLDAYGRAVGENPGPGTSVVIYRAGHSLMVFGPVEVLGWGCEGSITLESWLLANEWRKPVPR